MWKVRVLGVLLLVVRDYPNYCCLFLTLIWKNYLVNELRETVLGMNKSFARLTKIKWWAVEGWIRFLKVMWGEDGSVHSHFHCLLIVSSSYFRYNYLNYN